MAQCTPLSWHIPSFGCCFSDSSFFSDSSLRNPFIRHPVAPYDLERLPVTPHFKSFSNFFFSAALIPSGSRIRIALRTPYAYVFGKFFAPHRSQSLVSGFRCETLFFLVRSCPLCPTRFYRRRLFYCRHSSSPALVQYVHPFIYVLFLFNFVPRSPKISSVFSSNIRESSSF